MRLAIVMLVLATTNVHADDTVEEPYGKQTLVADLGALTIVSSATIWENRLPVELGLGAFMIGGPIVHLVHGKPVRAVASLGVRVAGPVIGLLAGDLLHQARNPRAP